MALHACHWNTDETDAGGLRVGNQPGLSKKKKKEKQSKTEGLKIQEVLVKQPCEKSIVSRAAHLAAIAVPSYLNFHEQRRVGSADS